MVFDSTYFPPIRISIGFSFHSFNVVTTARTTLLTHTFGLKVAIGSEDSKELVLVAQEASLRVAAS
jgi:hypothetical protein